jgi:hypothetical protein
VLHIFNFHGFYHITLQHEHYFTSHICHTFQQCLSLSHECLSVRYCGSNACHTLTAKNITKYKCQKSRTGKCHFGCILGMDSVLSIVTRVLAGQSKAQMLADIRDFFSSSKCWDNSLCCCLHQRTAASCTYECTASEDFLQLYKTWTPYGNKLGLHAGCFSKSHCIVLSWPWTLWATISRSTSTNKCT